MKTCTNRSLQKVSSFAITVDISLVHICTTEKDMGNCQKRYTYTLEQKIQKVKGFRVFLRRYIKYIYHIIYHIHTCANPLWQELLCCGVEGGVLLIGVAVLGNIGLV